ncbi:DUF896 domain-containing protein [Virgibacillus sp. W0430]|uniref:DUF896 domain-containing protein n=1 Tax=Virgibacillus sp. W0430 TaxID=3391580 RepID=UPI003F467364
MLDKKKIQRLNDLAKKAKSGALSEEEIKEQSALRKEYLQNIRQSFTNQLQSMTVIDPKGNDVTPEKVKRMQQRNKKN